MKPSKSVFVTSHGRQYHDPLRHRFTGSGKATTTIAMAKAQGYEPCAYCYGGTGRRPQIGRDPSKAYLHLRNT